MTNLWVTLLAVTALLVTANCKKDSTPTGSSRVVKFELTGNYSGKLDLAYTAADGSTVSATAALPWTKEITYEKTVYGLGLGGNSAISATGVAGQTVTVKIYSAGNVVKNSTSTTGTNGIVNLPTFAYLFP